MVKGSLDICLIMKYDSEYKNVNIWKCFVFWLKQRKFLENTQQVNYTCVTMNQPKSDNAGSSIKCSLLTQPSSKSETSEEGDTMMTQHQS